ncbi:hypothetical protein TGRUB_314310B, partial [Toxoplasma gondii RUB]
DKRLHFSL